MWNEFFSPCVLIFPLHVASFLVMIRILSSRIIIIYIFYVIGFLHVIVGVLFFFNSLCSYRTYDSVDISEVGREILGSRVTLERSCPSILLCPWPIIVSSSPCLHYNRVIFHTHFPAFSLPFAQVTLLWVTNPALVLL